MQTADPQIRKIRNFGGPYLFFFLCRRAFPDDGSLGSQHTVDIQRRALFGFKFRKKSRGTRKKCTWRTRKFAKFATSAGRIFSWWALCRRAFPDNASLDTQHAVDIQIRAHLGFKFRKKGPRKPEKVQIAHPQIRRIRNFGGPHLFVVGTLST